MFARLIKDDAKAEKGPLMLHACAPGLHGLSTATRARS
jgi:hypothetical protein